MRRQPFRHPAGTVCMPPMWPSGRRREAADLPL